MSSRKLRTAALGLHSLASAAMRMCNRKSIKATFQIAQQGTKEWFHEACVYAFSWSLVAGMLINVKGARVTLTLLSAHRPNLERMIALVRSRDFYPPLAYQFLGH